MKKFSIAQDFCSQGLGLEPKNKALLKLQKECKEKWDTYEEREKKRREERERREYEQTRREDAIKERNLIMGKKQHKTSAQFTGELHWDEDDVTLRWPVVFAYPEHSQCDFIESFAETDRIIDHLEQMFPKDERVFWDTEQKYVFDKLCVYYQTNATDILGQGTNYKKSVWKKVNTSLTLLEFLQQPEHIIPEIPIITVFVSESSFLKEFLKKEKDNS